MCHLEPNETAKIFSGLIMPKNLTANIGKPLLRVRVNQRDNNQLWDSQESLITIFKNLNDLTSRFKLAFYKGKLRL